MPTLLEQAAWCAMPRRASTRQLLPSLRCHVDDLAADHGIVVDVSTTRRPRAERASPKYGRPARIVIRPIVGQVSYAIALHELSHLLSRGNRSKNQLEREADSWRWVLRESRVTLTPATCARLRQQLKSYYERAMLRAMLGRRGAKLPEPESLYWQVMAELGERAGITTVIGEEERAARLRLTEARTPHHQTGQH